LLASLCMLKIIAEQQRINPTKTRDKAMKITLSRERVGDGNGTKKTGRGEHEERRALLLRSH